MRPRISLLGVVVLATSLVHAQDRFEPAWLIDDEPCAEGCRDGRIVRAGPVVARERIMHGPAEMPGGRPLVSSFIELGAHGRRYYVAVRGSTGSRCADGGAMIVEERTRIEAITLRDVLDGPAHELVVVVDHRLDRAHERFAIVCTLDRDPPLCIELPLTRRAPSFPDRTHVDAGEGPRELAFPAAAP